LRDEEFQILQSRDAGDLFEFDKVPKQDHETAVGEGEIALQERFTIRGVPLHFDKSRGCRNHHKPAAQADLNRLSRRTGEEAYAENLTVILLWQNPFRCFQWS